MQYSKLRFEDPDSFLNFTRIGTEVFMKLLRIIENDVCRQYVNMRDSMKQRDRLAVTLRFLATDETFQALVYSARITPNTPSLIIRDTLQAGLNNFRDESVKVSASVSEWVNVAHSFNVLLQFSRCVGVIHGKKVTFMAPRSEGACFSYYKGNNSITLLAIYILAEA
ncbi:uncharacterized protein LOC126334611 [Schistocerca gregaria]|uniref:uncharacterized protein LOC126334611 n=1 Tax=Schistocerca gregaria TaxID=7010 RepID=UPI00211EADD9|nr:uncharacterized protein LOC126334611 [Schistocerca gregaria]